MIIDYFKKLMLIKELEHIIFESGINYPQKILPTFCYALKSDVYRRNKRTKLSDYRSKIEALYAMQYYQIPKYKKMINFSKEQDKALRIIEQSDRGLFIKISSMLLDDIPLDEIVLNLADPELCYVYVRTIKNINVQPYGQVIIESQNPMWNYRFMKDIKGLDKDKHKEVILNSDNTYYKELVLSNNEEKIKSI